MVLGAFLARTRETHGKDVEGPMQPQKLTNKEQSQLSSAPSLTMLQVNQGLHKWAPDQDITKGLQ